MGYKYFVSCSNYIIIYSATTSLSIRSLIRWNFLDFSYNEWNLKTFKCQILYILTTLSAFQNLASIRSFRLC